MSEQGRRQIDFPTAGLHFDDAADDQVAYFWGVPRAEGVDGEEFVCFLEGPGDGGEDFGVRVGGEGVGAVAAAGSCVSWGSKRVENVGCGGERWERVGGETWSMERAYRIQCGSSVTVSPGVMMDSVDSLGLLEGLPMGTSPSSPEAEDWSEELYW